MPPPDPSPTPSPEPTLTDPPAGDTGIRVTNLTKGPVPSKTVLATWTTASVTVPGGALALAHVFACCDHAAVPVLSSPGLTWELVVTHTTGQKRHWVFRAEAPIDATGAVTISFAYPTKALWVIDYVTGQRTGGNGADAIGQTVWQNSMMNASSGAIDLPGATGAVLSFTLCGSGAATNIVPEAGYTETGEADSLASNIIIDTAYSPVPDDHLSVEFRRDQDGSLQVQSWLMLAVEVLPAAA
jgi:hypothetical protein